jgi:RimJ/RimL family protein N-acetyltransferase
VNQYISARRVALAPLEVDDADEMVRVLSACELYVFTGGRPPTLAELRAQYARQVAGHSADGREEWRNWIIRLMPDRTAIGYVQATVVDDGQRAEIAWVVGQKWQGQGYAKEAVSALAAWLWAHGVRTLQAHIHPGHAASAAVAQHAGLLPTGRIEDGEEVWLRQATREP